MARENELDDLLSDALDIHEEMSKDVAKLEAMLLAAGVQPRTVKAQSKKKAAAKRSAAVSPEMKARVLDAVRRAQEPVATRSIAEMIEDLAPSSVSKALAQLVKEGEVRQAGRAPGRGVRYTYEAVNGGEQHISYGAAGREEAPQAERVGS